MDSRARSLSWSTVQSSTATPTIGQSSRPRCSSRYKDWNVITFARSPVMPKTTKTSAGFWAWSVVRASTSGAAVVMSRLPPAGPDLRQASYRRTEAASSTWDDRPARGQTPLQMCAGFVTELSRPGGRLTRAGGRAASVCGQLVKGSDPGSGAACAGLRSAGSRPVVAVDLDPSAPEGVDAAPAPGYVEQLEVPDPGSERRVDDEVVADRLEPEHRPQQQERRAGRPRLRATRRRVLHGVFRQLALVAPERLRQAPLEELGRIQDPGSDHRRLVLEPVAPQPPGDERVVERPDGADVVADRVEPRLALGQRAHAPAGEEPLPHQMPNDRLRLRLVDDAAPEQVAVVRGEHIDLLPIDVELKREVLVVLNPEDAV